MSTRAYQGSAASSDDAHGNINRSRTGTRHTTQHDHSVAPANLTAFPGESAAQRSQRLQSVMSIDSIISPPYQGTLVEQTSTMNASKAGRSLAGVGTRFPAASSSTVYPQQIDESSLQEGTSTRHQASS